ncbi:uncharacterized protein LOC125679906 [Ostrea edulis]|uniref:uncharacterized protein LOC125679906 n=1 Tax=Ostrea edulis TaxID=37623 RepID=UPI0024AFA44D|nr:uncharacterized protein LOC125679906 [Ostrea edulis]
MLLLTSLSSTFYLFCWRVREDNSTNEWRSGRRVVELDVLAKLMYCVVCRTPLHLSNTEGEKRYGLASTLYIRCMNCHVLNDVHTGKKSQRSFDINLKLALAMVHTGLGPIQVNNFLATLNLPPTDPSTLKRRELKIDTNLEKMARESCLEATKEEMKKGNGKIEVSFDGGWQKRGTGWNYDSNTGKIDIGV